jgi:CRISPR-associated protein Cmr4
METRILALFTRTPLHVGAGASVGATDQPIVRERHTRSPVIPGTSLKGVLADLWPAAGEGKRTGDAIWLFGAEDAKAASAGALLIGEAKLLAFPVRSAKGAFA